MRVVKPPACGLLAEGHKPLENVSIPEWLVWGCQGHVVVGVYQGKSKLTQKQLDEYIPHDYHSFPYSREDAGR